MLLICASVFLPSFVVVVVFFYRSHHNYIIISYHISYHIKITSHFDLNQLKRFLQSHDLNQLFTNFNFYVIFIRSYVCTSQIFLLAILLFFNGSCLKFWCTLFPIQDFMSIIRIPLENEQKELIKYCVLNDILTEEMFENVKVTYKTIKRQFFK